MSTRDVSPHTAQPTWARPFAIATEIALLWTLLTGSLAFALIQSPRHIAVSLAWLAAVPVIIAIASVQAYCLIDLARPERRVKGRDKRGWAAFILCSVILGCATYLTVGREDF